MSGFLYKYNIITHGLAKDCKEKQLIKKCLQLQLIYIELLKSRVRWAIVCANCIFQGYFIINGADFFFYRVDQLCTYKIQ